MVDIHTHILPGIDDGARSWEMALHMCQMAIQDGTTHIVASPHANDEYTYDREKYEALLAELAERAGPQLQFSLGCDFHFSYDNLVMLERAPQTFTIGSTQYLLAELSDFSIPPWITTKLQDLVAMGLRPIITHPERNPILQAKPQRIASWVELGCPVQVTANSLTGRWGDKAVKTAKWLLERELVHIIASDCHNIQGRSPILSEARKLLEKNYGDELAAMLTHDNPTAVVENRDLPYFPLPNP